MKTDRREKKQEANREEIKEAARLLMREHGTAGLAIRQIATAMNITPAALYYYFPNLEALITALILDNYSHLAETLETARQNQAATSIETEAWAVILAYRDWALAYPVDYQLIFGNPIPGYQAPPEITIPAVVRAFRVFSGVTDTIVQTKMDGLYPEYRAVPNELEAHFAAIKQHDNYKESTLALYLASVLWTRMHGIVMAELTHHLQPTVGNTEAFYRIQMRDTLRLMGINL